MTTVEQNFETAIKTVLSGSASHLSDWLKENKEVEVSAEEICVAFKVPFRPASTPSFGGGSLQSQMPNIPNYFSTSGAGSSPAKKRGGRAKKEVNNDLPNCEYEMTRGKSKGQKCPNKILNDGTLGADRFCKACLKKAAVRDTLNKDSDKPTVQPPVLPGGSVKVSSEPQKPNDEVSVVEVPGQPGVYREQQYGFIITSPEEGIVIVHKIDENGVVRDLNDAERKLALSKGYQVATVTQTAPAVPQLQAAAPAINVPQVPTFPTLGRS